MPYLAYIPVSDTVRTTLHSLHTLHKVLGTTTPHSAAEYSTAQHSQHPSTGANRPIHTPYQPWQGGGKEYYHLRVLDNRMAAASLVCLRTSTQTTQSTQSTQARSTTHYQSVQSAYDKITSTRCTCPGPQTYIQRCMSLA